MICRNFLVLVKLHRNTKSEKLCSSVSRGKFGHTGTNGKIRFVYQAILCDTFKQARLEERHTSGFYFNIFMCVANFREGVDAFELKILNI